MPISNVPRNVAVQRQKRRLTRERLAVAADTSVSTIVRLEREGRVPSLPILERIAKALGTSVESLLSSRRKGAA